MGRMRPGLGWGPIATAAILTYRGDPESGRTYCNSRNIKIAPVIDYLPRAGQGAGSFPHVLSQGEAVWHGRESLLGLGSQPCSS